MARDMRSRNLNRRVQFLRAEPVDDGYQFRPGPHEPYGSPILAAKDAISDRERFQAGTTAHEMTDRFVVRWTSFSSGITGKDRISCEGVTYGIVGLKELGRRQWIEITAARVDQ